MRNNIANHNKIYGEDLGYVVFNAGYKPNEIPKEFTEVLKQNLDEHLTKPCEVGDVVDLVWNKGEIIGLEVVNVMGTFVEVRWYGDVWEYMKTEAPFKYSYGYVKVHRVFVRKGV